MDGSGQEYDVTLKWSVTHWYIGTVKSSALAAAARARPLADLAGAVLDPDDDPDAGLPTYLDDLAAELIPGNGRLGNQPHLRREAGPVPPVRTETPSARCAGSSNSRMRVRSTMRTRPSA